MRWSRRLVHILLLLYRSKSKLCVFRTANEKKKIQSPIGSSGLRIYSTHSKVFKYAPYYDLETYQTNADKYPLKHEKQPKKKKNQ